MKSAETHDCVFVCDFVVHFGVAVGSVIELEQAVMAATARPSTA
jgi:hypothetical protein